MKAGLFGSAWEDYLDAVHDAFDKATANSWPRIPGDASAEAHLSVLMNDAGAGSFSSPTLSGYSGPSQATDTSLTRSDVMDAVDQAKQFAEDVYARYAPGNPPPSAAQQANDLVKISAIQHRLSQLKQSNLSSLNGSASESLSNYINWASLYLYQAAMNAHLGSVSNIPQGAGDAMRGEMDTPGVTMPNIDVPQKIGPHY